MKRVLLSIMAVALVMIVAAPAMADFSVGLMSFTDIGYRFQSEDRTGLDSDRVTAFLSEAVHSRLYVKTSNENMSGYMELGMGFGGDYPGENVNFRKIFGDYKFGDFKLTVGHTELMGESEKNPSQLMGLNEGAYIIGMGFGNLYTRSTQVRLEQRTGIWYWGISANTPIFATDIPGVENAPTWLWSALFGVRTDMFWATLDGQIAYNSSDDAPDGADDSLTAWLVGLNIQGRFGLVTVEINPFYSQNVGDLGYWILDSHDFAQVSADGRVEDTDVWGGWVDVTIGGDPFAVHLIGGYKNADNSLYDDDAERMMLVVRGEYKIAANFTLSPEFGYYDYGDSPEDHNIDLGNEFLVGMQFQFVF